MKKSILFLLMMIFLSSSIYAEEIHYYFNKVTSEDIINVRNVPNGNVIGQLKFYKPYTKWTLYEFDGDYASYVNQQAYFGSFYYETNGEIYDDGLSMLLLEDANKNNGWYKIKFFDGETMNESIGYIHKSQIEYISTPNNIEVMFGYNPNTKSDELDVNYDKYDMFCLNSKYYIKPLINTYFKPYVNSGKCDIIVSLENHFPMGYICSYDKITLQDLYNKRLFWNDYDEKMPKKMPNKSENKVLSIKSSDFIYDYDYQVNIYDRNNIVISFANSKDKEFEHRYLFTYDESLKKATLLKCTGR